MSCAALRNISALVKSDATYFSINLKQAKIFGVKFSLKEIGGIFPT